MNERRQFKLRHEVPQCCINCTNIDDDIFEEYGPSYYYCILNLFLPVKKNTCKKYEAKYYVKKE